MHACMHRGCALVHWSHPVVGRRSLATQNFWARMRSSAELAIARQSLVFAGLRLDLARILARPWSSPRSSLGLELGRPKVELCRPLPTFVGKAQAKATFRPAKPEQGAQSSRRSRQALTHALYSGACGRRAAHSARWLISARTKKHVRPGSHRIVSIWRSSVWRRLVRCRGPSRADPSDAVTPTWCQVVPVHAY